MAWLLVDGIRGYNKKGMNYNYSYLFYTVVKSILNEQILKA